jgi:hypothetical protein
MNRRGRYVLLFALVVLVALVTVPQSSFVEQENGARQIIVPLEQHSLAATTTKRPNADGSETLWGRYPSSGGWYDKVDETSQNGDTDYWITSITSADCWAHIQDSTEAGTINSVTVYGYAKLTSSGSIYQFMLGMRLGTTEVVSSTQTLSTSYAQKSYTRTTDPNGGSWDWTDIDSLQIGVRGYGFDTSVRCTQLYAIIDYTPNVAPEVDDGTLENPTSDGGSEWMFPLYTTYIYTANVSDSDGYADIDYVNFFYYSGTGNIFGGRYDEDDNSFVEYGAGTADWVLKTSECSYSKSGNDLDITFKFIINFTISDYSSKSFWVQVYDSVGNSDGEEHHTGVSVESDVTITLSTFTDGSGTTDRGDYNQEDSITATGTAVYQGRSTGADGADIWCSSPNIAGSPWSDTTVSSGAWSMTVDSDDSIGDIDSYWFYAVEDGKGSGGTKYNTSTVYDTYIADQIIVTSISTSDARDDVNDYIWTDITLDYVYGGDVTTGTVTSSSYAFTHIGSGVWRRNVTSASVTSESYASVAVSGDTHGITSIDQNGQSQTVIWDRIKILSTYMTDYRINIGDQWTVYVTAELEYDSHAVTGTAGDTLYMNGTSMTWSGPPWNYWRVWDTYNMIGSWIFYVNATGANEATYGITEVFLDGNSATLITDRVIVMGYTDSQSSDRLNLGTSDTFNVWIQYEYDSTNVTDGSVTVNGISFTWLSGGNWTVDYDQAFAGTITLNSLQASGNTHGITVENQNGQSLTQTWDCLSWDISVSATRVSTGTSVTITALVVYVSDGALFNNSDSNTLTFDSPFGSATYSGGVWTASSTESTVKKGSYGVASWTDNTYGITNSSVGLYYDGDSAYATTAQTYTRVADRSYSFWMYITDETTDSVAHIVGWEQGWRAIWLNQTNHLFIRDYYSGTGGTYDMEYQFQTGYWYHVVMVWDYIASGNIDVDFWINGTHEVDTNIAGQTIISGGGDFNIGGISSGGREFNGTIYDVRWYSDKLTESEAIQLWQKYDFTSSMTHHWSAEGLSVGSDVLYDNVGSWDMTISDAVIVEDTHPKNVEPIFDAIKILTTVATDGRIDYGTSTTINVTAELEYDSHPLGISDTLYMNGTVMTWDTDHFYITTGAYSIVDLLNYFVNATGANEATYGITSVNLNSQDADVIWDMIEVYYGSDNDPRDNIYDNDYFKFRLRLAYDSHVLNDGSNDIVYINSTLATWDGGGTVWYLYTSQSTVGLWYYLVSSASEDTYGITALNTTSADEYKIAHIWDKIEILTCVVTDGRIDYGTSTTVNVTAQLAYDSHPLGSGDTLYMNGTVMTWDTDHFYLVTGSYSIIDRLTYYVNSTGANEATYGITWVDGTTHTDDVIWDLIEVYFGAVSDDRTNVNEQEYPYFRLRLAYDSHLLDDGTNDNVWINGSAATWGVGGTAWYLYQTYGSVIGYDFIVTAAYEDTYGITALNTTSADEYYQNIIWDRIEFYTSGVDDGRINYDWTGWVYWEVRYDYDDVVITSGLTASMNTSKSLSWNSSESRWDYGESGGTVQKIGYEIESASESTYGLTAWVQTSSDQSIIWDRIEFYTSGVIDDRIDYTWTGYVYFEVRYDYDDVVITSGLTAYLNGSKILTWNSSQSYWNYAEAGGSITKIGYEILSASESTYGLTAWVQTSSDQSIIWDTIEVYFDNISDADGRTNIDENENPIFRLRLAYDSHELNDGTNDQVYINGSVATWYNPDTYWYRFYSYSTPVNYTFVVTSAFENTYGITSFNTTSANEHMVWIVWDAVDISMTDPTDQRQNVGANATGIYITILYSYDSTPYDGTYNLNDTTFDYSTVGKRGYTVSSVNGDDSYGITYIYSNDETWHIWDMINVTFTGEDDGRINVDESTYILFQLVLVYDGHVLGSGDSAYANSTSLTWNGTYWRLQVTNDTVLKNVWNVTSANEVTHGITALNSTSDYSEVIWDRIYVYYGLMRGRVGVSSTNWYCYDNRTYPNDPYTFMYFDLRLEYDDTLLTTGDEVYLNGTACTYTEWITANWDWVIYLNELGYSGPAANVTFLIDAANETEYGITELDSTSALDYLDWIIFDYVVVYAIEVEYQPTSTATQIVGIGDNMRIEAKAHLAWDGHECQNPAGGDSLKINSTTSNGVGNGWWFWLDGALMLDSSTTGNWSYIFDYAFEGTYDIGQLWYNNATWIVWDRINMTLTPNTQWTLVGQNITVDCVGYYDYLQWLFNGTVTITGGTLYPVKHTSGNYTFTTTGISNDDYSLVDSFVSNTIWCIWDEVIDSSINWEWMYDQANDYYWLRINSGTLWFSINSTIVPESTEVYARLSQEISGGGSGSVLTTHDWAYTDIYGACPDMFFGPFTSGGLYNFTLWVVDLTSEDYLMWEKLMWIEAYSANANFDDGGAIAYIANEGGANGRIEICIYNGTMSMENHAGEGVWVEVIVRWWAWMTGDSEYNNYANWTFYRYTDANGFVYLSIPNEGGTILDDDGSENGIYYWDAETLCNFWYGVMGGDPPTWFFPSILSPYIEVTYRTSSVEDFTTINEFVCMKWVFWSGVYLDGYATSDGVHFTVEVATAIPLLTEYDLGEFSYITETGYGYGDYIWSITANSSDGSTWSYTVYANQMDIFVPDVLYNATTYIVRPIQILYPNFIFFYDDIDEAYWEMLTPTTLYPQVDLEERIFMVGEDTVSLSGYARIVPFNYTVYEGATLIQSGTVYSHDVLIYWDRQQTLIAGDQNWGIFLNTSYTTKWLNGTYSKVLLEGFGITYWDWEFDDFYINIFCGTSWGNATLYIYDDGELQATSPEAETVQYRKLSTEGSHYLSVLVNATGDWVWKNSTYAVAVTADFKLTSWSWDIGSIFTVNGYISTNWGNATVYIYQDEALQFIGSEGAFWFSKTRSDGMYLCDVVIDAGNEVIEYSIAYTFSWREVRVGSDLPPRPVVDAAVQLAISDFLGTQIAIPASIFDILLVIVLIGCVVIFFTIARWIIKREEKSAEEKEKRIASYFAIPKR